jgi:hypothetical protein
VRPYSFRDNAGHKHSYQTKKQALASRAQLGVQGVKHPIIYSGVKLKALTPTDKAIVRAFRTEYQKTHGKPLSNNQALKSRELAKILRDIKSVSVAPGSPKANALVRLGRRQPTWNFPVGQTPPGVKAYVTMRTIP